MVTNPITTLQPPPPTETRVLHIDAFGVDFPTIEPASGVKVIGQLELRGASHPLPSVVVRKGTL